MPRVVDMEEGRIALAAKRAYRNWESRFEEHFGPKTGLKDLSLRTLCTLAHGRDKGTFYLYDLIMNLENLGSGFEFNELSPGQKMRVIDRYLFLLDRLRFECMKRLGWLEAYPGENMPLVDMVLRFDEAAPDLQARIPSLSRGHPGYERFARLNTYDREAFIRKLIPRALKEIEA